LCVASARVRHGGRGLPAFCASRVPSRHTKRTTRLVPRAASVENTDLDSDWVKSNEDQVRVSPLVVGGVSVATLLLNRILSGVAPVADASSAQSRADVLCLGMAGCLVLTGLQWLAVKQKPPTKVVLEGVSLPGAGYVSHSLPESTKKELRWVWDALRSATMCKSLLVVYRGKRVAQFGTVPFAMAGGKRGSGDDAMAAMANSDDSQIPLGPITDRCIQTGSGNYLANLILFPGRVEFENYLPRNTMAVVVMPVGNEGVLVAGSDTQRGFTPADQAWLSVLAEKLDASLSGEERA